MKDRMPRNQAKEAMSKFTLFHAADYLTDEETISEYLNASLEEPNPDLLIVAERDVADARLKNQVIQSGEKT
jgi:DNA-binding phage protein